MPAIETSPGARLLNRELSWLDFNERVLAMAEREDVPLLERAKFLAIYSQNLDEFFQVRVAGLEGPGGGRHHGVDTRTGARRRNSCSRSATWSRSCRPASSGPSSNSSRHALAEVGIIFSSYADLDEDDVKWLDEVFEERIFPVLTPLAVDPGPSVPVHLASVTEPRGRRPRSRDRATSIRAR